jgi:hypothetical protein
MRFLVLVLWVSFLVYGDRRIRARHRSPPAAVIPSGCVAAPAKETLPHFNAARAMKLNWRLRDIDLAARAERSPFPNRTDYLGKYVACKIEAGEPVIASDLAVLPTVPQASSKVLYLLPLKPTAREELNAGNHIDLFLGARGIVSDAHVEAVVPGTDPAGWDAVLQISPAEDQLLKEQEPQKLKWILRQ